MANQEHVEKLKQAGLAGLKCVMKNSGKRRLD